MVRINTELMMRRRIQLGWTSEELAEKSGLDARTIRRLEQGRTRARLHTAVAVAQALTLDTSAFVLSEGSSADERSDDEGGAKATFKAAENTFQTELACEGDQGVEDVTRVLSLLLTRYGLAFSRRPQSGSLEGLSMIESVYEEAKRALSFNLTPGGIQYAFEPISDESIPLEPQVLVLGPGGKRFRLGRPSRD